MQVISYGRRLGLAAFVAVCAVLLWVIVNRTRQTDRQLPDTSGAAARPATAGDVFEGWDASLSIGDVGAAPAPEEFHFLQLADVFTSGLDDGLLPVPRLGAGAGPAGTGLLPAWLRDNLAADYGDVGGYHRARIEPAGSMFKLPGGWGMDFSPGEKMKGAFSKLLYGEGYETFKDASGEVMQGILESFRFNLTIEF